MVSHPDTRPHHAPSTSLVHRGARSVAGDASSSRDVSGRRSSSDRERERDGGGLSSSRSTLSRARRYNRSHAGGATSYVPLNEFPVFSHSGDVEIVVRVASGHENRYLLHRHTLTRCSGFFEASTSNEWSRARTLPDAELEGSRPEESGKQLAITAGDEVARVGTSGSGDAGDSPAGSRPRKRWRYELDTGAEGDDIPMLVQQEEDTLALTKPTSKPHGPPPTSTSSIFGGPPANTASRRSHRHSSSTSAHSFFRSVANLSLSATHSSPSNPPPLPPPDPADADLLRDYDNLFRIMYNYPPHLDAVNIADAYVQCKSLLTLADLYDALPVVGPRVDHHLLQFQSRLWKQIAKYPISYLRLGYLARSKVIFQEAMVHVVGQWPAGERSLRANMPPSVMELIEDKVDDLAEAVGRAEARLFRLGLTTRSGERVSPATGFLDWLALSLFRQWLADNTAPPPPPPPSAPPDRRRDGRAVQPPPRGSSSGSSAAGGATPFPPPPLQVVRQQQMAPPPLATLGRTYRTLGSGTGYLGHEECKRFLKLAPELYSRDNLRRFEKRVDELRAMAREAVRPLMGSGLELDVAGGGRGEQSVPVGYLTCTRIGDRDLPWDE